MNQKKLNITLLVLLGLLVVCSIILGLTNEPSKNTIENKEYFSVQDTSKVDLIGIHSNKEDIVLKKTDGVWKLNDSFMAEPNIIKILLSILRDSEVVRNVPKTQEEEISNHIANNGFLVEISGNGELLNSFYTAGNDNKTVSYMMSLDKKSPAIVNIPGYESYVAGIFEISASDWRDRVILRTNWRSLKNLQIKYTEYPEYDLNIKFEFNFLTIEGISNLDTARMMAYIDEFNFLQADRYLEKNQNAKYDSLLLTPSTVSMTIEDISPENSKSIDFFPLLPNDPMMLGYVKEDEQRVLFEANRIQKLFAVKADFEVKPNDSPSN